MPLAKQLIATPFLGLGQGKERAQIPLGKLKTCENYEPTKTGGLRKVDGQTSLSRNIDGGGSISTGRRVAALGGELIVSTDQKVYSYGPTNNEWYDRGKAMRFSAQVEQVRDVGRDDAGISYTDVAVSGNIVAYVYIYDNVLYRTVVDKSTNTTIIAHEVVSNSGALVINQTRIVASGGTFVIAYLNTSGTLLARAFTAADPATLGTETTVQATFFSGAGGVTNGNLDLKVMGDDGTICAFGRVGAGVSTGTGIVRFNTSLTSLATQTYTSGSNDASTALGFLAHDEANGVIYTAIADATDGVKIMEITKSSLALAATRVISAGHTDVRQITGYTDGSGNHVLYYERPGSAARDNFIVRATWTGAAATAVWIRGAGLLSKAFRAASLYHVFIGNESSTQPTYFLVDENAALMGRFEGGYGGGVRDESNLSSVAAFGSSQWVTHQQRRIRIRFSKAVRGYLLGESGCAAIWLDNNDVKLHPGGQAGDVLCQPGALPSVYDGVSVKELGSPLYPEIVTTPAAAAGGVLDASSTYLFVATYSYVDAKGNLCRSAPSVPVSLTTTGANLSLSAELQISTLRITGYTKVRVELWRTEGNGTVFYYVEALDNDTTADTVTTTNADRADADISSNETLYVSTDQIENFPPPACKQFFAHGNRVWAAGCEDPNVVWPSKLIKTQESISFNPDLALRVDAAEGGINCGASMDTFAVLFARNAIFVVNGEGPDDLGNGAFPEPQIVTTRVGCENPRSLALTPLGLFFESPKGIYLLTRSLQAVYIGEDIQDTLSGKVITGTLVVPDKNQVRFYTTSGTTLCYDWNAQQWFTRTNQAAVSSAVWQNDTPVFLKSDGTVVQEVAGQFTDDGSAIISTVRTGPLQLGGIAGYQRLWKTHIVGEFKGNHTLTAKVYVDDDTSADVTLTKAITSGRYQYEIPSKTQLCATVDIELIDSFPGGATEGAWLSALTFECGVVGGAARLPATSKLT